MWEEEEEDGHGIVGTGEDPGKDPSGVLKNFVAWTIKVPSIICKQIVIYLYPVFCLPIFQK